MRGAGPGWGCRLLGLYDQDDLKDAEPDTLRYRLWHLPARLARHARQRVLKISRTWPWNEAFLACWQRPVPPRAHRAATPPAANPSTRHHGRKPAQHN
jgi:hypothetical protein